MKKFIILAGCLLSSSSYAQNINPAPGNLWIYYGPTLGSGWGALTGAQLPNPSPTTLGGVKSISPAISGQFLNSLDTTGTFTRAPALIPSNNLSDISSATTSRTNLSAMDRNAAEAVLPTAQINLQVGVTFDAYGAVGNGTTNDQTAMQSALDAGAGGTVFGVKGKIYTLRGQVYIPSNTTVDCRGAMVQFDPTLATFTNAMFWIGSSGTATGVELAGTNVEIKNCNFRSAVSPGYAAIMFQPGSSKVKIHHNTFTGLSPYQLRAVALRASRLSDIQITDNTGEDIKFFTYVDGDELQTWTTCVDILSSTTSQACTNAEAIPAVGTTTFAVSAAAQVNIAAGQGYAVIVHNRTNANNTYRLFGPYDNGSDFTYSGGTITFNVALPTAAGTEVQLVTWNPAVAPANDLTKLVVARNTVKRLRGAGVQINCPVRQYHKRKPYQDCINDLVIEGNEFSNPYQLSGMTNSWPTPGGQTNYLLWSQDFSNAAWPKTRSSIGTGTTLPFYSPSYDFTATAQKLVEDSTAASTHFIGQTINGVSTTGNTTFSCSVKAAERSRVRLYLLTNVGNGTTADFNLLTGARISQANQGTGLSVNSGINYQGYGPPGSDGASGWWRVWVTGVLDATTLQPAIYIENNASSITYDGDGASGLYLWGCQIEKSSTPSVYLPTSSASATAINTQLISVNGVNNFTVANNVLGPAAQQCIHLEDYATNGSVIGNTCRDAAGAGIYAVDAFSVVIKNNTISNSYTGCVLLDSYAGASTPATAVDGVMQNGDITIEGNKCDGQNNPAVGYGYHVTHGSGGLKLRLADNSAVNMPAGIQTYKFNKPSALSNGWFDLIGAASDNLLRNPSFDIDQLKEGADYTAPGHAMDGWRMDYTTVATGVTIAKSTASPLLGSTNNALITIGTGSPTVNAGDFIFFHQRLRGADIAGTMFGTSAAQPLAVSFKTKCSVTGTYSFAIQNAVINRTYIHQYVVATANTDTFIYAVIPGDTSGTWVLDGASQAMEVKFPLAAGSNFQTTLADQWLSGAQSALAGQVQLSQTTGATCRFTDVKVEISPVPTMLRKRPFQQELLAAQAFYRKTFPLGTAVAQNAGVLGARCVPAASTTAGTLSVYLPFDPPMNSNPTILTYNPSAANANWRNVTGASDAAVLVDPSTAKSATGVQIGQQTTALTEGNNYCIHATADARL